MPTAYSFDPFLAVQHALVRAWLDPVMVALSWLCEGWVLALVGVAWAAYLQRSRAGAIRVALPLLLALAADGVAVRIVKLLWNLPRPSAVFAAQQIHVLFPGLSSRSMPSGHASAAAVLAAYLLSRHRWSGAAASLLAVAGGIARVYVGAHWVLDVVVGWAIGAAIGLVAAHLASRRTPLLPGHEPSRPVTGPAAATRP